jgi:hypothetical protein
MLNISTDTTNFMGKNTNPAESTVPEDPKTKPAKHTTVRRIKGFYHWFEPTEDLTGSRTLFGVGILREVVFDPKAPIMRDVFCGKDRVSEATATGILQTEHVLMPNDATVTCKVDYDPKRKVFHVQGKPNETFESCDYLVLHKDGSSTAGWKVKPVELP